MADTLKLQELAKLIRFYILKMTTEAGSGHPTSSLSAADLATALFFGKLRYDTKDPQNPANDRVIFSKGHASPLFYALWAAAGEISGEELAAYRKFESPLEGHPTPRFKFAEAATGSLGQGLSIGVGMALAMRLDQLSVLGSQLSDKQSLRSSSISLTAGLKSLPVSQLTGQLKTDKPNSDNRKQKTDNRLPMVYVLLGDSEMAEGSVWEACEIASFYKLSNVVAIVDVNRLGQSGETMLGWDTEKYAKRFEAFSWEAHVIDGHNLEEIAGVFDGTLGKAGKPTAIIAKTVKGKGVSFLEDKEGWHGKALPKEDFEKAVRELGEVDRNVKGEIAKPKGITSSQSITSITSSIKKARGTRGTLDTRDTLSYKVGEEVATRKAYGEAIAALGSVNEDIVVLDGEVKNSTFAEIFKEKHPERFLEMFIAEQNMAGVALGLAKRGKVPFASTFAAFWTRAFDQVRMAAISGGNIKFIGSHAGVAIGEDGPSQMGLEDIAMFRSVFGSTVLCPGDANACLQLVSEAAACDGIVYIRTNRPATPVIYRADEEFKIGGSKVVRSSNNDKLTIVACGVTLVEAIAAAEELAQSGVNVRVVDAYSIKPIDEATIKRAAKETGNLVITVEDHYPEGGLGDVVLNVFATDPRVNIHKLAVYKMPMSGKGDELLEYEGISKKAIISKVKSLLMTKKAASDFSRAD
ncbi:transketolase [Candidatus Curtissbacteria bacterium]|nr:transketolase [Candidatus Curtissbacteria bacterium]